MRAKQISSVLAGVALVVLLNASASFGQEGDAKGGLRIRLPGDVSIVKVDATVLTQDGRTLRASAMGDTLTFSPGAYKLSDLTITARLDRKEWSFTFSAGYGETSSEAFPVQANMATLLRPKVTVEVDGSGSGRDYSINLTAIGPLGLKLSDASVGGERPDAAKFSLVAPNGAVVDSGEFEYG